MLLTAYFIEKNPVAFVMLKTLLVGECICDFQITQKTDISCIIVDRVEAPVQLFNEILLKKPSHYCLPSC